MSMYTTVEAREKARQLLFSWLTPDQQLTMARDHYFDVRGNDTGKTYRITTVSTMNNVSVLDDAGVVVERHCCYPRNCHELPNFDVWLAQALSITANERAWLRVATISPVLRKPGQDGGFPHFFGDYHAGGGSSTVVPAGYTTHNVVQLVTDCWGDFT